MKLGRAIMIAAVLTCTAAPSVRAQALSAADQTAVVKLAKDYEAAWAKGDAKAVAAFYTTDALDINDQAHVTKGRAAIEQDLVTAMAGPMNGPMNGSTIKIMSSIGWALRPDVAIVHGSYTIHMGKDVVNGHWIATDVKGKDGAWSIATLTGFIPQAPPTAPTKAAAPTKKP